MIHLTGTPHFSISLLSISVQTSPRSAYDTANVCVPSSKLGFRFEVGFKAVAAFCFEVSKLIPGKRFCVPNVLKGTEYRFCADRSLLTLSSQLLLLVHWLFTIFARAVVTLCRVGGSLQLIPLRIFRKPMYPSSGSKKHALNLPKHVAWILHLPFDCNFEGVQWSVEIPNVCETFTLRWTFYREVLSEKKLPLVS